MFVPYANYIQAGMLAYLHIGHFATNLTMTRQMGIGDTKTMVNYNFIALLVSTRFRTRLTCPYIEYLITH